LKHFFKEEYEIYLEDRLPVFHKNKFLKVSHKGKQQFYYRSAIDNALRSNQINSVEIILSFIVKYQNNFVSSYLFIKNFNIIIETGVKIKELL
jgi:hypothetical protein